MSNKNLALFAAGALFALAGFEGTHAASLQPASLQPEPIAIQLIQGNTTGGSNAGFTGGINDGLIAFAEAAGFAGTLVELARVHAGESGDGALGVSWSGMPQAPDLRAGSWDWSGSEAVQLVTYKAGNRFAAVLYDPGVWSAQWSTELLGLLNQNPHNPQGLSLSHLSVWGFSGTPFDPLQPGAALIPLPAAGGLLLSGLLCLGLLRRR